MLQLLSGLRSLRGLRNCAVFETLAAFRKKQTGTGSNDGCNGWGHGHARSASRNRRVHAEGRRGRRRARHPVRRRQRLPRPARRHDGVGVDPGRRDDGRGLPPAAHAGTILEANLSQTIGSASTSLATGTIFTIPALFLWGMAPPYLQVVTLALPRRPARPRGDDPAAPPADRQGARRAALPGRHRLRRGAARDERRRGRRDQQQCLDLPRHGGRRRGQAGDLARFPHSR